MRKCPNWLDTYMDYTEHTEPPDSYHQWCSLSILAACLRRQVWINMGFFNVYPNMYTVLVGPPATRKNTAINIAVNLALKLDGIHIGADSTSREKLIRDIKESKVQTVLPNGDTYEHSSLTIVSKELSVFLGSYNHDLLSLLTDLYDNHPKWEYRTKNMGVDVIYNEWLNLLGGTTPTWLVGSVPLDAIGGGFTSRIIFVVEHEPRKKVARPRITDKEVKLHDDLLHDLELISTMCGEMKLTKKADEWFEDWYEHGNTKKSHDMRFDGYYGRKHIHLLKVAILVSASYSSDMMITDLHLKSALYLIEQLEDRMIEAFGAAGRSILAQDIDVVLKYIQDNKTISRNQLLKAVWRDVNPKDIDIVIKSLCEMKMIKPVFDKGMTFYEVYKEE